MDSFNRLGIIIAASLGASALILLTIILICLLRRAARGPPPRYAGYVERPLPESVWRQHADYGTALGTPSVSGLTGITSRTIPSKKVVPPEGRAAPRRPWLQRTVRRAQNMLRRLPAVFQVKRSVSYSEFTGSSATAGTHGKHTDGTYSAGTPTEEKQRSLVLGRDDMLVNQDLNQFSATRPAVITSAGNPYVAKVYSDYSNPKSLLRFPGNVNGGINIVHSNIELRNQKENKLLRSQSTVERPVYGKVIIAGSAHPVHNRNIQAYTPAALQNEQIQQYGKTAMIVQPATHSILRTDMPARRVQRTQSDAAVLRDSTDDWTRSQPNQPQHQQQVCKKKLLDNIRNERHKLADVREDVLYQHNDSPPPAYQTFQRPQRSNPDYASRGEQVTSRVFEFLKEYDEESDTLNIAKDKQEVNDEEVTNDAFRFLQDFEDDSDNLSQLDR